MTNIRRFLTGTIAFVLVLLFMPLGHTLMILNERLLEDHKLLGAAAIGFLGIGFLFLGVKYNKKQIAATLMGLLAGVLIWTGWVEFSFVWIAEKLMVAPLIQDGEVATKPEYLVMMSSAGLLGVFLTLYFFKQTNCQFFTWFQNKLGYKQDIRLNKKIVKPLAVTTFIETVVILWTFYIVLLLVYDPDIAGDRHPLTYLVAFGSLLWAAYLFLQLIRIKKLDYAVRYAIPTVIIFWNFVEVMGRWNLFKEIWVHPFEHWLENTLIIISFIALVSYIVFYYLKPKRGLSLK